MCNFFSVVSINTRIHYFDWEQRELILKNELIDPNGQSVTEADSHSQICAYYGLNADKVNKYESRFPGIQRLIDETIKKNKSQDYS